MNNDRRYSFKLLGVVMIEITNVTPEKLIKILWTVAKIVLLMVLLIQAPDYITAIRWW